METNIARSPSETEHLCYVNAAHIEGPLPTFQDVDVRNRNDRKIGRLDGMVIDPAERSVRYLVVDDERFFRHHRYLLPLELTRVDLEHRALCVDVDRADLTRYEEFDPVAFPGFSDDDLLTALFARDRDASSIPRYRDSTR